MRPLFACLLLAALVASPAFGQDRRLIVIVQAKLQSLGHDEVQMDGRAGPVTRKAVADVAEKYGFEPTIDALVSYFTVATAQGRKPVTDEAILAKIDEEVKHDLFDPFSAHLRDIYALPSGNVCGEVNAKNQFGAYVGWTPFLIMKPAKIGEIVFAPLISLGGPESDLASYRCQLDF